MTARVLTHELPQLLRVEDVASRLSVCTRTVRDLVRDGALVVYRVGRAVRIDSASVEAYLCRHRVAVPQPVPPISEEPTSTDAAASGTRAAGRSGGRGSRCTPPTPPKRSGAFSSVSANSQTDAGDIDPWAILRPSKRRSPTR